MRHQAAIHSNPPVTMPTRYPSPARPTTCSAEILEASSDMPMNGHRRSRPARKYSASVCFLPAARSTAPTTNDRLARIMTESRNPNTPLLPDAGVIRPRVIVLHPWVVPCRMLLSVCNRPALERSHRRYKNGFAAGIVGMRKIVQNFFRIGLTAGFGPIWTRPKRNPFDGRHGLREPRVEHCRPAVNPDRVAIALRVRFDPHIVPAIAAVRTKGDDLAAVRCF